MRRMAHGHRLKFAFDRSAGTLLGLAALCIAFAPIAHAAPSIAPLSLSDSYGQKISITESSRPSLLKGLMAPDPRSEATLKERLDAKFPGPVKEVSLTETLAKQGFKVTADTNEAYYSESLYPCLYLWRITWDEDSWHNVRHLNGRARSSCA